MTGAMPPKLTTRKPTGKPSWPILLLAGAEKTGKSYSAAVATSSPLIGRSYWVTIGEDEPDEYGQLGDFDIVQHDGTYQGILGAIRDIDAQIIDDRGTPLLVVDSMTRLWDIITSHAQDVANQRARKKGRASQDQDAQITMDLWNAAKDQWQNVMDAIRAFPGPVILTARLDVVAVMNDAGQPTPQKTTKVQAHKSLPYDVGAVIEMPARGDTWITGVRSVRLKLGERTKAPKDFTVDWFWRQLGLDTDETSERDHKQRPAVMPPRVEQDHDGPNVVKTMREGNANRNGDWGDNRKTEARLRDSGGSEPVANSTPPGAQRPGGSRPTSKPAAGPADTAQKSDVFFEWVSRISQIDDLDALIRLHADAADRHVLDHKHPGTGTSIEDAFLARREELLTAHKQAQAGEPEPVDEYTDEPELDGLPF